MELLQGWRTERGHGKTNTQLSTCKCVSIQFRRRTRLCFKLLQLPTLFSEAAGWARASDLEFEPDSEYLIDIRVSLVCQLRMLYHFVEYELAAWKQAVAVRGQAKKRTRR